MHRSWSHRPSPATVIATVALFVALGGSSYAAITINGSRLKNHTVAGKKLKANTVTGNQINESTLGTVPDASTVDGKSASAFLPANGKAADADKLDGKSGGAYSLTDDTLRAGVANGVGNDAGCASGTLAIVVRDGHGDPVDHRFSFIVPTAPPEYGQVRSDGSLRQNSTHVTSVSHTARSGIYCIAFTAPAPNQAQIESSVAAIHDSN